jgi:hypothetical protein
MFFVTHYGAAEIRLELLVKSVQRCDDYLFDSNVLVNSIALDNSLLIWR